MSYRESCHIVFPLDIHIYNSCHTDNKASIFLVRGMEMPFYWRVMALKLKLTLKYEVLNPCLNSPVFFRPLDLYVFKKTERWFAHALNAS